MGIKGLVGRVALAGGCCGKEAMDGYPDSRLGQ